MSETLKKINGTSKTHLNNIMQLAIFSLNDGNLYGINVSKIRSFEEYARYDLTKNYTVSCEVLEGYIKYQGKIIPVLSMEKWLGIYEPQNEYKIYLVCEYNKTTVAFPICHVHNIYNVPIERLQRPEVYFSVVTYNVNIVVDTEETTCMVLDVEKLLHDTFGNNVDMRVDFEDFDKIVLVAEDSNTAQEIVSEILGHGSVKYKFFDDGQYLIDYLGSLDDEALGEVGLVITDLEMPRRDGYQVIKFIKETPKLAHLPVVVNSSMSNAGVDLKTQSLGVAGFVAKTDPKNFIEQIKINILR